MPDLGSRRILGWLCTWLALAGVCAACASKPAERAPTPPLERATPVWRAPRPGTAEAPHAIGRLPYTHRGNTDLEGERREARDPCAPGIFLAGPEVTYAVTLLEPTVLRAVVVAERGVTVNVSLLTNTHRCLMRGSRALERRVGPGRYRIRVDTRGLVGGWYRLDVHRLPLQPRVLGSVWNTYYYLAQERDHAGEPKDAPLLSAECTYLADVPKKFHDDLCIEGSGLLADGRVVNYSRSCTRDCFAAVPCGRKRYKICYQVLDPKRYPYGMGSQGRVLEPDLSIAVDPKVIPLGTVLYLPELDGAVPPGRSAPHDGCVRADDVGGAIKGDHIDIFSTTRRRWRAWERIFPTRSWFTVILHHPRCAHLPGGPS